MVSDLQSWRIGTKGLLDYVETVAYRTVIKIGKNVWLRVVRGSVGSELEQAVVDN